jgi:RNA polymerase sigma-70 factor (ECF subfamily)
MKTNLPANQPAADVALDHQSDDGFARLYRQYVGKVFRTCLSMTNDEMAAQDYTQDIFLKAFEKRNTFQNRSSFSTWLYAISYNHCLTKLQQDNRRRMAPLTEAHSSRLASEETADDTEYLFQAQEAALSRLPAEEQKLLRLKYEQGLSIQQIGQQVSLSESAVKMRLKRSRERLVQSLLPSVNKRDRSTASMNAP